jgi:predicted DNA-binding transcriptional regulator AlpA
MPAAITIAQELPKKEPPRLIGKKEVCRRTSLSFPTIWKLMQRDDEFPRSLQVGGKTMWLESEVDAWILSRPRCQYKGDRAKNPK